MGMYSKTRMEIRTHDGFNDMFLTVLDIECFISNLWSMWALVYIEKCLLYHLLYLQILQLFISHLFLKI